MSTAPFTTACWALGIACFAMIVAAVPLSQRQSREVARIERPGLFAERRPESQVADARTAPTLNGSPNGNPVLRLATSDVNAPLGLDPNHLMSPRVTAHQLPAALPPAQESLTITVPDPVEPPTRAAPAPAPVVKLPPKIFTPADFRRLGGGLSAEDEKALRQFLAEHGVALTRQGFKQWSYQFDHAPLEIVLALLAAHADRPALVAQDVSGTFSGAFTVQDPWQAFVLVVKSQRLQLGRRGENWLVMPPRDQLSATR